METAAAGTPAMRITRPRGAAPHGPGGVPNRWNYSIGVWELAATGEQPLGGGAASHRPAAAKRKISSHSQKQRKRNRTSDKPLVEDCRARAASPADEAELIEKLEEWQRLGLFQPWRSQPWMERAHLDAHQIAFLEFDERRWDAEIEELRKLKDEDGQEAVARHWMSSTTLQNGVDDAQYQKHVSQIFVKIFTGGGKSILILFTALKMAWRRAQIKKLGLLPPKFHYSASPSKHQAKFPFVVGKIILTGPREATVDALEEALCPSTMDPELVWTRLDAPPISGQPLESADLSAALARGRTSFTKGEFNAFKVRCGGAAWIPQLSPRTQHVAGVGCSSSVASVADEATCYICAGGAYYVPTGDDLMGSPLKRLLGWPDEAILWLRERTVGPKKLQAALTNDTDTDATKKFAEAVILIATNHLISRYDNMMRLRECIGVVMWDEGDFGSRSAAPAGPRASTSTGTSAGTSGGASASASAGTSAGAGTVQPMSVDGPGAIEHGMLSTFQSFVENVPWAVTYYFSSSTNKKLESMREYAPCFVTYRTLLEARPQPFVKRICLFDLGPGEVAAASRDEFSKQLAPPKLEPFVRNALTLLLRRRQREAIDWGLMVFAPGKMDPEYLNTLCMLFNTLAQTLGPCDHSKRFLSFEWTTSESSKPGEAREKLRRLKNGEIDGLIVIRQADRSFDCPRIGMTIDLNQPRDQRFRAKSQGTLGRGVRLRRDARGRAEPQGEQELWVLDYFCDDKFYERFIAQEGACAGISTPLELERTGIPLNSSAVTELCKPLAFDCAHVHMQLSAVRLSSMATRRQIELTWPYVRGTHGYDFRVYAGLPQHDVELSLVGRFSRNERPRLRLQSTFDSAAWWPCLKQHGVCEFSVRLYTHSGVEYRAKTVTVRVVDFPHPEAAPSKPLGPESLLASPSDEAGSSRDASEPFTAPSCRRLFSDVALAGMELEPPLVRRSASLELALEMVRASEVADAADAAKAASATTPSSQYSPCPPDNAVPLCSRNHEMVLHSRPCYRPGLRCNAGTACCGGSGVLAPTTPRFTCSICDFNVCADCAHRLPVSICIDECSAASSSDGNPAATPMSQGRGRQEPSTAARIHELGGQGLSVVDIDRRLHNERYLTSTGTLWPSKNDGRVVVRQLLNGGIHPIAGDEKIACYVATYAAKLAAKASTFAHGK